MGPAQAPDLEGSDITRSPILLQPDLPAGLRGRSQGDLLDFDRHSASHRDSRSSATGQRVIVAGSVDPTQSYYRSCAVLELLHRWRWAHTYCSVLSRVVFTTLCSHTPMMRRILLLGLLCSRSLLHAYGPAPLYGPAPRPRGQGFGRRGCAVSAERKKFTLFPPVDPDKPYFVQAAKNLFIWLVILTGPELAGRIPAYSSCVPENGREACASVLPIFDFLYHLGFPV